MRALIHWIISMWELYWNGGMYQYLLLIAAFYLLFFRFKKAGTRQSLPYLLAILFIFFFPFTAYAIRLCIGESVYWRVLWLIPLIPILALAGTEFIKEKKSCVVQCVLLLLFVGVLSICGTSMRKAGNYVRLNNPEKVPDEVAYVCQLMREIADEQGMKTIRVASDDNISSYIRVYDPEIKMPYGRWAKGALDYKAQELHDLINSDHPDYKKLARRAKQTKCRFLVIPNIGKDPHKAFAKSGFQEISVIGEYWIFQRFTS